MLRSLLDLADHLAEHEDGVITPLGYARVGIRWIVPLDADGNLARPPLRTTSGEDDEPRRFVAPDVVRSNAIKPKLLADNGEYTFGLGRERDDPKVERRHASYVDAVRACADATGSVDVQAVLAFLEGFDRDALEFDESYEPAERITFEVEGRYPIAAPEVVHYWANSVILDSDLPEGEDLLTGSPGRLMETEPTKIKGIPGGQTSGTNLVSANSPAYLSYGATQALIAPILVQHADRYAKALNHLLGSERHHLVVGPGVVYVFWTDSGWAPPIKDVLQGRSGDAFEALFADEAPPSSLTIEPDPEDVRRLLTTVWTGREPHLGPTDEAFHAVALSASGSRVIVRDRTDTTVERVRRNLRDFVARAALVAGDGSAGEPVSTYAMSASLYHDARKHMAPNVPTAIVQHALDGRPLPESLLDALARRNAIERRVTRPRAALARLVLTSLEVDMQDMDQRKTDRPEASYHLGRLLAALESLQYEALGSVGATIVDRFYGSFSTAPASVLGRLMQSAQDYVGKIRSQKGTNAGIRAESSLGDILVHVDDIPDTLDSRGQALFSLGYYHERAAHWKAIREHKTTTPKEEQA